MSEKLPRLSRIGKLGICLVIVSTLLWVALVLVPFLPLTASQKAFGAVAIAVTAEVLFWIGALLTGKEVVQKYRNRIHPRNLWRQLKKIGRKSP